MLLKVNEIIDNNTFEFNGDVHVTGNIGKNAVVHIKNGNLTVDGSIAAGATIKLMSDPVNQRNNTIRIFNVVISETSEGADVRVGGRVDNNVTIKTPKNITIIGDIGQGCVLETTTGNITAQGYVGESTIKTSTGNIHIQSAHPSAIAESVSGQVTIQNRLIKTNSSAAAAPIATSSTHANTKFDFNSKPLEFKLTPDGRMTLGGHDITEQVRRSAADAAAPAPEPATEPEDAVKYRFGQRK